MRASKSADLDRSMVVAMIPMGVMEMSIDEVVDVIPMRDGLVPAVGSVHVLGRMCIAVVGLAARRVRGADLERVLFHGRAVGVMQVSVV